MSFKINMRVDPNSTTTNNKKTVKVTYNINPVPPHTIGNAKVDFFTRDNNLKIAGGRTTVSHKNISQNSQFDEPLELLGSSIGYYLLFMKVTDQATQDQEETNSTVIVISGTPAVAKHIAGKLNISLHSTYKLLKDQNFSYDSTTRQWVETTEQ